MAQNFLTGINIVGDALSISGTSAISSARHFDATTITVSSSTNRSIILDYTSGSGGYSWMSFKQSGTEQFRVFGSYSDNYLSFYNDQSSYGHMLMLNSNGTLSFYGDILANLLETIALNPVSVTIIALNPPLVSRKLGRVP